MVADPSIRASEPLRSKDLVPFRHILGASTVVLRVNADGTFSPFQHMPMLFFQRPLRRAFSDELGDRFIEACSLAVASREQVVFHPDDDGVEEVLVKPILADDTDDVRFLICWVRTSHTLDHGGDIDWQELTLDQISVRYRRRTGHPTGPAVDVSPWWARGDGELHELWPHHTHVSAMGLGHAAMEMLIISAAAAAAEVDGGPAVRVPVPSAEILSGLVPVFHAAIRATRIDPARIMVAIDVDLATDPDLLPIIVHLRTMGMKVDIVGLETLTATLHLVSDTAPAAPSRQDVEVELGEWLDAYDIAAAPVS